MWDETNSLPDWWLDGLIATVDGSIEVVTVKKVRVEKVLVPTPPKVAYKPLADPKTACHGAPVVITEMIVSGSTEQPKETFTWLTVRPAGDEYTVQCFIGGDYTSSWEKGDLVSLVQGKIASSSE